MAAMKTMTGVALDARPSMRAPLPASVGVGVGVGEGEGGVSKLALGVSIINYHIVQRQLASKTVEFSVSSFGSGVSNNYCCEADGSCPDVDTVVPMGRPTGDDIRRIDGIAADTGAGAGAGAEAGAGAGAIADGIAGTIDRVKRVNAGKKFNRILLLLTDGDFLVSGIQRLEDLVAEMKANDIVLYVALLGEKPPAPAPSPVISENSKLLASMAAATGGAFSVLDAVSDSFYFLAGRPGMTTRPLQYKIPFYISPSVKIRCTYWGKVSKASLPSLKKQAPSYDPADPESGGVKRITSYFNPDDPDEEVPFDEKVKGYRYGSQYVPVTAMDEAALKLSSEPLMRLLGFLPESKLQRHHFMDSTLVLQGEEGSGAAARALASLCAALRRCQSVALVRFVKRKDSDPWLAALLPFPSSASALQSCLMIQRLPCAEDIRDFPFPSLYDKRYGEPNTTTQMKAVSDFVDDMTIIPDDVPVFNPAFPALIRKILGTVISEPNLPNTPNSLLPEIVNPLNGLSTVLDRAQSSLKRIATEFPLVVVDKKKKKRKIYWSDYDVAASSEDAKKQHTAVTAVCVQ
jgi:hypothetical protein